MRASIRLRQGFGGQERAIDPPELQRRRQAQDEEIFCAINACTNKNLLALSLSKGARCRGNHRLLD